MSSFKNSINGLIQKRIMQPEIILTESSDKIKSTIDSLVEIFYHYLTVETCDYIQQEYHLDYIDDEIQGTSDDFLLKRWIYESINTKVCLEFIK